MSDVNYPLVCPFSTLPGILVLSRTVMQLTRFTADVLDRVCSQAAFGANTALVCTIVNVIEVVALITFDVLDGCNGKRGDAELVIAYSRSGEIYLSNKENFAAQDAAMRSTFDKVIVTNSVLSELVMSEKTATLSELEQGFSGTTQRLIELETQAIENSQRLARVLDEQRTIMRELGIEHLYKDPNTPTSGFVPLGFLLIDAAPAKKSQPRDNIFIDPGSEDRR